MGEGDSQTIGDGDGERETIGDGDGESETIGDGDGHAETVGDDDDGDGHAKTVGDDDGDGHAKTVGDDDGDGHAEIVGDAKMVDGDGDAVVALDVGEAEDDAVALDVLALDVVKDDVVKDDVVKDDGDGEVRCCFSILTINHTAVASKPKRKRPATMARFLPCGDVAIRVHFSCMRAYISPHVMSVRCAHGIRGDKGKLGVATAVVFLDLTTMGRVVRCSVDTRRRAPRR